MNDLAHLTYEQRRTWEELDRFAYAWAEGEAAAIKGTPANACPYEVEAGTNTPRRRWYEGYIMAIQHGKVYPIPEKDLRCCYMELSPITHNVFSALISRLVRRIWRAAVRTFRSEGR